MDFKIIGIYPLLFLILLGCTAKKIELSNGEKILASSLSVEYNCKVEFTLDQRSVDLKRIDGIYSVNFDFTGKKDLCKSDSISVMCIVKECFPRIKSIMTFKENHSEMMLMFSQVKQTKGIQTSTCEKWFKIRLNTGEIIKSFNKTQ